MLQETFSTSGSQLVLSKHHYSSIALKPLLFTFSKCQSPTLPFMQHSSSLNCFFSACAASRWGEIFSA